jgi:hypothetical protein
LGDASGPAPRFLLGEGQDVDDRQRKRLKARWRKRLLLIVNEADLLIREAEAVMRRYPDYKPIDLEDTYLLRAEGRKALAELEAWTEGPAPASIRRLTEKVLGCGPED